MKLSAPWNGDSEVCGRAGKPWAAARAPDENQQEVALLLPPGLFPTLDSPLDSEVLSALCSSPNPQSPSHKLAGDTSVWREGAWKGQALFARP